MAPFAWSGRIPTDPWAALPPTDRTFIFSFLVTGFTLFSLLFLFCRFVLLKKYSYDFSNRVVSVVHCALALVLSTRSVSDWHHPLASVGGPNSPEQSLVMLACLPYFAYDLFCCSFEVPFDFAMAFHHVFTILGLAYGIISGHSCTELVACLWLMELSNPCMHTRELIKELGAKKSTFATVNDIMFALVFTLARVIFSPFVVSATLQSAQTPVAVKMGAVAIQLVSLFWFYKIIRAGYYKVKNSGGAKEGASSKPRGKGRGVQKAD